MNITNRQLKFRAWHPELKYFIYFDSLKLTCIPTLKDTYNLIASPTESVVYHFFNTEETIQQFTGLQDKNGKDIYEGDILTSNFMPPENQVVIFENGYFTLDYLTIGCGNLYDELSQNGGHRIIGNIFETPELLQEKT